MRQIGSRGVAAELQQAVSALVQDALLAIATRLAEAQESAPPISAEPSQPSLSSQAGQASPSADKQRVRSGRVRIIPQ